MAKKRLLSPEQDRAADPLQNIWVQANAGTGKTSVLVQRLLRILFRSNAGASMPGTGVASLPGILCLTYTNAGASEMRNRILAALREWARASDDDLRDLLHGISLNEKSQNDPMIARDIFYRYIDRPDMLKIRTIHGFCEEILRRFPIEAGIPPAWGLISDSGQKILLADAFNKLINSPVESHDANGIKISDAFSRIVERISEHSLDELLDILTSQYKHFFQVKDISIYRKYFIDTTRFFLELDSPIATEIPVKKLQNIIENAQSDINSSKKPASYLTNIVNLTKQYIDNTINFEKYKTAYLTVSDSKNSNVARKDYLADEQDRVYKINQRNIDNQIFDDTVALFDLAAAFASTYRALKAERNLLDFDDMILYTRKLFSKPDTMGWVLSQLDMAISHILVDEAQDTSPEQWDILQMLSGDFFAEGSTESHPRSLFVVGDTKQSIYGFQGADPSAFATSRDKISAQIRNNLRTINEVPLTQSFRSTAAVLGVVDYFFGDSFVYNTAGFINNEHKCFRTDAKGLVEIHGIMAKQ